MEKITKIPSKALIFLICLYQNILRPYLGYRCRFTPSCSNYALEALKQHSFIKAMGFIFFRIGRCHPFSKGGYDPISKK